jgi:hypothetical protein
MEFNDFAISSHTPVTNSLGPAALSSVESPLIEDEGDLSLPNRTLDGEA